MIKPKIAIATVVIIALSLLYAQRRSLSSSPVSLSKEEMESLLKVIPQQEVERIRSQPEGRKQFIDNLKRILTLGLEAKRLGIEEKPEVVAELALMEKIALATLYRERMSKQNPQAVEFSQEQIKKYLDENPSALDNFLKANPQYKAISSGDAFKQEFARMQLMLEGARRIGLDNDLGYKTMVKVQRAAFLSSRVQQEMFKTTKVSDAEINSHYEANKSSYDETRASHILVAPAEDPESPTAKDKPKTKEEARQKAEALLARIKAGEDFAKLAKENSDDPGSAQQGGDLGYFRHDVQFVPEFKEAVFKLKVGEVSDIVETQFGYHIIKVTDKRIAPLDESLKAEIREQLVEKKVREQIEELQAKNLVAIDENFNLPGSTQETQTPQTTNQQQAEHEGHGH